MSNVDLPAGVRQTAFGFKARGVRGLFSDASDAHQAVVESSAAKTLERRELAAECRAMLASVDATWVPLSDRELMQRIFDGIAAGEVRA